MEVLEVLKLFLQWDVLPFRNQETPKGRDAEFWNPSVVEKQDVTPAHRSKRAIGPMSDHPIWGNGGKGGNPRNGRNGSNPTNGKDGANCSKGRNMGRFASARKPTT